MERLTFEIFNRDFSAPDPVLPRLEWQVERYSTHAIGGCYEAIVSARGDVMSLWELLEVLRCPVQIRAAEGNILWWGYINAVDIVTVNPYAQNQEPIQASASLETMYNRIAVAYNIETDDGSTGERATTAWADDDFSQDIYGIKELLATGGDLNNATMAENWRDVLLDQKRLPISEITFRQTLPSRATIRCFGWWQSLNWKYVNIATDTDVDTATQIVSMCNTYGQFFSDVDCQILSGITSTTFRDGDATALYNVEKLMNAGTTNKRRILSYVDLDRRVRIFEEPNTDYPRFQHSDGNMYDGYGVPLRASTAESGYWARLTDILPPNINQEMLANPDFRFIETCEYDVKNDLLNLTYRDALDPFDIGVNIDG